MDTLAREGADQEGGGWAEAAEGGYDFDAEAFADAMHQWVEYGTGPYPSDDGTGWLAVSTAPCLLVRFEAVTMWTQPFHGFPPQPKQPCISRPISGQSDGPIERPPTKHNKSQCLRVRQDSYHDPGEHNIEDGVLEVDPHISAAPVFFDVDGGGKRMVVPVSYFFTSGRR